jgi:hypothetical protein
MRVHPKCHLLTIPKHKADPTISIEGKPCTLIESSSTSRREVDDYPGERFRSFNHCILCFKLMKMYFFTKSNPKNQPKTGALLSDFSIATGITPDRNSLHSNNGIFKLGFKCSYRGFGVCFTNSPYRNPDYMPIWQPYLESNFDCYSSSICVSDYAMHTSLLFISEYTVTLLTLPLPCFLIMEILY